MSRSSTQWKKKDVSYQNYIHYIKKKPKRFELTLIDLLYLRNFKGVNASIHEKENLVNAKLKKYSENLRIIHKEFGDRQLRGLSKEELRLLKSKAQSFICLTLHNSMAIDGFKTSYASALLHFHFPNLIPILDRRVLAGVGIDAKKDTQGQVINIENYYPALIDKFYIHLKANPTKSLRDYDKENFTKRI